MISYYPPCTPGAADKIQFEFLVIMKWKIKTRFYTGKKCKTIILCQRGDLPQQIFFHIIASSVDRTDAFRAPECKKSIINLSLFLCNLLPSCPLFQSNQPYEPPDCQ